MSWRPPEVDRTIALARIRAQVRSAPRFGPRRGPHPGQHAIAETAHIAHLASNNHAGRASRPAAECARQESNLRPRAPEARALSPELRAPWRTSLALLQLEARIVTLPLAETFVISRETQDEVELVEVALTHDGVTGYGEAAPIERYDESVTSARAWLEQVDPGDDPWAPLSPPTREYAAHAALDAAFCDLQGKLRDEPIWRMLGLERGGPPASWSV